MNTFTRAISLTVAAAVVALGVLSGLCNTLLAGSSITQMLSGAGQSLENTILNGAIDASGIKGAAEDALRGNVPEIAAATGMTEQEVEAAIDRLDISSWSVTDLPAGASPTGTIDTSYQGANATVTTYADPSYITVDTLGQSVTLAVPESAQGYIAYLGYL